MSAVSFASALIHTEAAHVPFPIASSECDEKELMLAETQWPDELEWMFASLCKTHNLNFQLVSRDICSFLSSAATRVEGLKGLKSSCYSRSVCQHHWNFREALILQDEDDDYFREAKSQSAAFPTTSALPTTTTTSTTTSATAITKPSVPSVSSSQSSAPAATTPSADAPSAMLEIHKTSLLDLIAPPIAKSAGDIPEDKLLEPSAAVEWLRSINDYVAHNDSSSQFQYELGTANEGMLPLEDNDMTEIPAFNVLEEPEHICHILDGVEMALPTVSTQDDDDERDLDAESVDSMLEKAVRHLSQHDLAAACSEGTGCEITSPTGSNAPSPSRLGFQSTPVLGRVDDEREVIYLPSPSNSQSPHHSAMSTASSSQFVHHAEYQDMATADEVDVKDCM